MVPTSDGRIRDAWEVVAETVQQVAELVYDATLIFCYRFIDKRSRTHDHMVQAARSGKQNIVEGSVASGTSKKGELKLTNSLAPVSKS